mgnify:CR=1 FL=1
MFASLAAQFQTLPIPAQAGVVFAGVCVAILAVYAVVAALVPDPGPDPEPSLADAAMAAREPRSWAGRVDRSFQRGVKGTLLGVRTEGAVEWVLFAAVVAAAAVYLLTFNWVLAALAFVAAPLVPLLAFVGMQSRYRAAVQEQLPDGIAQLARSLRAGLALEDAVGASVRYSEPPLKEVFGKIGGRLAMGVTPAAVVALPSRTGGNLPLLLDRLAASVRDRNQFRGYFQSAVSLSVVTAVFVALVPLLAAGLYAGFYPELFRNFFVTKYGPLLLGVAVLMWLAGVLVLVWLVRRMSRY